MLFEDPHPDRATKRQRDRTLHDLAPRERGSFLTRTQERNVPAFVHATTITIRNARSCPCPPKVCSYRAGAASEPMHRPAVFNETV